jgi:hypothetical protein
MDLKQNIFIVNPIYLKYYINSTQVIFYIQFYVYWSVIRLIKVIVFWTLLLFTSWPALWTDLIKGRLLIAFGLLL